MRVIGEQRAGDITVNIGQSGQTVIEETYNYIVEADSKSDNKFLVSQCQGLPKVGLSASPSGLTVCKSISGQRRAENPKIWDFSCNFSSEVDENTGDATGLNPESWVPVRRTLFEKIETQEFADIDGKVFATSANEPFADGITRFRFLPVWEFDQFEDATVTDEDIIDRTEKVNDATYLGYDPNTLLIRVVDSTLGFFYRRRLRLTRYRVIYKSDTWNLKVLDKGEWYLDANNERIPFPDGVGRGDWIGFLDGAGNPVQFADPKNPDPNEFVYLEFKMYEEINFNSFLRF